MREILVQISKPIIRPDVGTFNIKHHTQYSYSQRPNSYEVDEKLGKVQKPESRSEEQTNRRTNNTIAKID